MPLPRPILDDRSYEQLRDELVRRIPVYTREWTDHNPSDPGITLLELFSYLGENLLYRFNQIPETTRLEFLRLLQIPLRPARPSRAMLTLTTELPAGVLVEQGTEAKAGSLSFESRTEVRALPVEVEAYAKAQRELPDAEEEPEVFEFFRRAVDAIDGLEDGEAPVAYENELVPPQADGLPVDFDETVDGMLWVAVLAPDGEDPNLLREAVIEHRDAPVHLNLGFVPDPVVPSVADISPCPGEGNEPTGPAVDWQISTGEIDGSGEPVYRALRVGGDTTGGLRQEGVVRLELPDSLDDAGAFVPPDPDAAGSGDLPPPLDDDKEARVLFWLRAYRRDESRVGKVLWVGANATEVEQLRRARTQFLGTGTGTADQRFKVIHTPVAPGSLVLEVEDADGWQKWTDVDAFHASGEQDRHFVLDPDAGEVRFGNTVQGYVPQIGQRIRARSYRYGGGAAGNVAVGAISKLPEVSDVEVSNPLPASGGADAEAIEKALERIPGELRRRDRAVTRGDFRELASMTPGADVGRAEVLALFHPHTRLTEAAGVVSVVVWPRHDPRHPGAPLPDRGLLRRVCKWLDARRLVTTELYVIPPTYRKVAVSVGLVAKPGFGIEAVRNWVELVIRQYLAPLPPYGPSGEGWPLGRRVHGPELEAAALQIEGVEFLEGLEVAGWDARAERWVPGTVELALDDVPELVEITVVEGEPLTPGEALGPPPAQTTPVPIPVEREAC
jgi:hypothetical protein